MIIIPINYLLDNNLKPEHNTLELSQLKHITCYYKIDLQ